MKISSILGILVTVLMLGACNQSEPGRSYEPLVFTNDFDAHFGTNEKVVKGPAHSGFCALQMDSTLEFSPGFLRLFKDIHSKNPSKVKASYWVNLPNPDVTFYLVTQVWDVEKMVAIDVQTKEIKAADLPQKEWVELVQESTLTNLARPERQLRCFIHNPNRQKFLLDDFSLTFTE